MSDCAKIQVGEHWLGGAVGEHPTAIIGTIFSGAQRFLEDPEEGRFEAPEALRQIERGATACRRTAVPYLLDVVAETPRAMERELSFVVAETSLPFLIDASDEAVRLAGLRAADRLGALGRTVYNSIGPDAPDEELELLARLRPAAIVVSTMDPANFGAASALEVLREVEARLSPALHGRLLLDVGFLDEASPGVSCRAAQELRRSAGLPVGGAPCNGLQMWEDLKTLGEGAFVAALAATLGYCAAFGLDFLFAGPLRRIPDVAPALAAAGVYNRYALVSETGRRDFSGEHPIRALFGATP